MFVCVFNFAGMVRAAVKPFVPKPKDVPVYQKTTVTRQSIEVSDAKGQAVRFADFVQTQSLNGHWQCSGLETSDQPFAADTDPDFARVNFDDDSWDSIAVPLDWYRKYPNVRKVNAKGVCEKPYVKGWYRKQVSIDATRLADGGRVLLDIGVAGYDARLFVNGKHAGDHHGDFTPWHIDITEHLKAGNNQLAIRILTDFGPKFSPSAKSRWTDKETVETQTQFKAIHVYGSQWSISNIKAGLWQDVQLRFTKPIYFEHILIDPQIDSASLNVRYQLLNTTKQVKKVQVTPVVISAMKDEDRRNIAGRDAVTLELQPGRNTGSFTIQLQSPRFWSPDTPLLYDLAVCLTENQNTIAMGTERFGYRQFQRRGNQFYLNGKRIYLYGENIQSVRMGGFGKGLEAEKQKFASMLQTFKSQGYNIIRSAHMPFIQTLDVFDEMGMMLFNEWGWSFTKDIDEQLYEQHNLKEITQWVHRDYNHPSVVMWSMGNEIKFGERPEVKRQMEKQVQHVRKLDTGNRPISSFSGSGTWPTYGKDRLETDVIDLHTYNGLSGLWVDWEKNLNILHNGTVQTYKDSSGQFNLPYIIWECVGFSWGKVLNANFRRNDIKQYMSYVKRDTNWAKPNGIGFSGTIGLAAALDPKRSLAYGRAVYGKRILEQIRADPRFQGFAPWFSKYVDGATVWTQPIFSGLRDEQSVLPRGYFAKQTSMLDLIVVNNTDMAYDGAVAHLSVAGLNGVDNPIALQSIPINTLANWSQTKIPFEMVLPEVQYGQVVQLRLEVMYQNQSISCNSYDIYVQSNKVSYHLSRTSKKIGVLNLGREDDLHAFEVVLRDLGVLCNRISPDRDLSGFDVLMIPPATGHVGFNPQWDELFDWVKQGGVLLMMEQRAGAMKLWPGASLTGARSTFADLVIPDHPIFAGLEQFNFDTWNNADTGKVIHSMVMPFTHNAIAARGPMLGRRKIGMAIVEGKLGKGHIVCSQLDVVKQWGVDPSASTYLRNLLKYITVDKKVSKYVQPWEMPQLPEYDFKASNAVFINLRGHVNRSFKDDVNNDGKGGWTDQGSNDFRSMPLGKQTFAGVPFEIIDPATQKDASCIVLYGTSRPAFPKAVRSIPVNATLKNLSFLHTAAWGKHLPIGEYTIHYADGSTQRCVMEGGQNIGDWWDCDKLPNAYPGVTRIIPRGNTVGLYVTQWENPTPNVQITTIDILSYSTAAVPVVVAITGQK
ncbi:MAG TPA: hypothetical protein DCM28_14290 [Phycisphaerales bacterium]|nr:hypothetical protein [Phycisphaerales bacterium]